MEIQLWREILSPYELAVKELVEKFNHLIREHKECCQYSGEDEAEENSI
mgnify:CR=1 FL=1